MVFDETTDDGVQASRIGLTERRSPRFSIELSCWYSKDHGSDCDGTVFDLSQDGCAVRKTAHVQRGDYVRVLIFPSPNQSPIEVSLAVVRWSTIAQFGVEFTFVYPRDAKRLHDFLTLLEAR